MSFGSVVPPCCGRKAWSFPLVEASGGRFSAARARLAFLFAPPRSHEAPARRQRVFARSARRAAPLASERLPETRSTRRQECAARAALWCAAPRQAWLRGTRFPARRKRARAASCASEPKAPGSAQRCRAPPSAAPTPASCCADAGAPGQASAGFVNVSVLPVRCNDGKVRPCVIVFVMSDGPGAAPQPFILRRTLSIDLLRLEQTAVERACRAVLEEQAKTGGVVAVTEVRALRRLRARPRLSTRLRAGVRDAARRQRDAARVSQGCRAGGHTSQQHHHHRASPAHGASWRRGSGRALRLPGGARAHGARGRADAEHGACGGRRGEGGRPLRRGERAAVPARAVAGRGLQRVDGA